MDESVKVLVVDDEPGYRDRLTRHLARGGWHVRSAAGGREAIDVGTRYRPDVLVADWMLKDRIHGLHVVSALRAVLPRVRTVLITGYPSEDVRTTARQLRVDTFLEKPFELDALRAAVQSAATSGPAVPATTPSTLAMLEIDAGGAIRFVNEPARGMLAQTSTGAAAPNLAALFEPHEMPDLSAGVDGWVAVRPRADAALEWRLRTQALRPDGSRLVLLSTPAGLAEIESPTLELLLGTPPPPQDRWPFAGRVLVVDDDAAIRHVLVRQFDQRGAGSYAVGSPAEALQLLAADDGIAFVIHDFDLPHQDLARDVARLRAARPAALLIGTSGSIRREDFARLGIEHYLQKPWRASDLINLLLGRLGNCVDCGLFLPLRRARAGEHAASWICAGCGGRYRGVFDETVRAELHRNAVRAAAP